MEVKAAMTQLWLRMSEIYGAQFANQYGQVGGESFQTWVLSLRHLTPGDIKHGFTKLLERESTFVPNLNEFRLLCKRTPEDLGFLSTADAWREVCRHCHEQIKHLWSSPAVYEAGSRIEFFNVRKGAVKEKEFISVYEQVCAEVMEGKVFAGPRIVKDETTLEQHKNGKAVSARQKNDNLAKGNAALSGLKGLFR
jgi:hypothetical protein